MRERVVAGRTFFQTWVPRLTLLRVPVKDLLWLLLGVVVLKYLEFLLVTHLSIPAVTAFSGISAERLSEFCQLPTPSQESRRTLTAIFFAPVVEEPLFRLVLSATFLGWAARLRAEPKDAPGGFEAFLYGLGAFFTLGVLLCSVVLVVSAVIDRDYLTAVACLVPALCVVTHACLCYFRRPLPRGWTPFCMVATAVSFSAAHLSNYSACHFASSPILALLVIPQLLTGTLLTGVAVRYGLRTSAFVHSFFNAFLA